MIKYVVTSGYRCQSYNLVDLRIHDVNVVADLHRQGPDSPNPEEPVECDGTSTGQTDTDAVEAIGLSQYAAYVESWWTGWWPLLHLRFSRASPDGTSLTVQFCVGLLPTDFRVEQFSLIILGADLLADLTNLFLLLDTIVTLFSLFPMECIALFLFGFGTGMVCQLAQSGHYFLMALAAGMIITYSLFYLNLLLRFISTVKSIVSDPLVAQLSVLFVGITNLVGLILALTLFPKIANILIPKLPLINRLYTPYSSLSEWWKARTDASFAFMAAKIILIAVTFFWAFCP